ncbi:AarF/ABC1/UbiB kinase family protein [Pseudonocardia petroleophila]|uniref:AarF/ABC1/UbiB kinase family protein n=1 Tax=Pseudonocardia petroleophila TaxID=37331 RepID=A0A7G7MDG2_9PSEU|nr:AarF/ABC1/UbiB kinase family protein [Pseudonocardia petroleophila]QNG50823.1 AarF/ABC1/UbiB kinase family protein [Pseudonocardia petroleophila]
MTTVIGRRARLAAVPLSFGGRAVAGWGRRLAGADADAVSADVLERNAEQLFAVLGQLRGGAMKVGQALSVYEPMLPAEFAEPYRRALTRLQAAGPAMPVADVHRVLDTQLGSAWRTRFREFDAEPAAAASVGQVHRAVWHDGRAVAVKVQYPGAGDALDADLRTLERFSRVLTMIVPELDARAVLAELRRRMLDELDYRAEAAHQRVFAAAFDGDEHLAVAKVVASAPRVIVSEWLDGEPLGVAMTRDTDAAQRDRWARTIVETMFSTPARLGLLHADPHPGNVLVLPDGRLGLVDFGAVAELPDGVPPVLATILRHVADGDADAAVALMRAEGFVAGEVAASDVLRFVGGLADPLREPRFRFHRAWLARHGARVTDLRGRAYRETGRALSLPAGHMVVVRVLSGWCAVLAQLDCTVDARGLAREWLPGFR